MITKDDALQANEFHYTGRHACTRVIGPRGGITVTITQCRRSGQTQTWKTRPAEFRVPVKYGMWESGEITHANADEWHVASACVPIVIDKRTT